LASGGLDRARVRSTADPSTTTASPSPSYSEEEAGESGVTERGGEPPPSSEEVKVPRHLAVIMDGNYRWALQRGRRGEEGHAAGIDALRTLVECSVSYGVRALTVYAFSVDNWKRGDGERSFIFTLFERCLNTEISELLAKGVCIRFIGVRTGLPHSLRVLMDRAESLTRDNTSLHLTIAINYSARADIVAAARGIARAVSENRIGAEDVDEDLFQSHLSTSVIPPSCGQPDLLLRTSGEERLSNFLLWELAYTELCFVKVNWPDFNEESFENALQEYSKRDRRYGGRTQDQQ